MDRIRVIEESMRCFVLGLLSLIPLAGLGMGILALVIHLRVRAASAEQWNPADSYLNLGSALAALGVLVSLGLLILAALYLIR